MKGLYKKLEKAINDDHVYSLLESTMQHAAGSEITTVSRFVEILALEGNKILQKAVGGKLWESKDKKDDNNDDQNTGSYNKSIRARLAA